MNNLCFFSDKIVLEAQFQNSKLTITCLLSTKGLLWLGTSCGCILAIPLPRLGGVPIIKGRPYVSYRAHVGPVKFLMPIQCALFPVPKVNHLDANASRTCTLDSRYGTLDSRLGSIDKHSTLDNRYGTLTSGGLRMDQIPKGTLRRTKFHSTPDLLSESVDDVNSLYKNLLSGTELKQCFMRNSDATWLESNQSSIQSPKRSTLPANHTLCKNEMKKVTLFEEPSENSVELPEEENYPGKTDESTSVSPTSSCSYKEDKPSVRLIPPDTTGPKGMVVVSGGNGHVNWSTDLAVDYRYEDVCLLLWQQRL